MKKATQTNMDLKTRESEWVPTHFLKLLADTCRTNGAAGKLLGVSGTVVSKSLKDGKTRKVNELAARAVYQDRMERPKENKLVIISASDDDLKSIRGLLQIKGGSYDEISRA